MIDSKYMSSVEWYPVMNQRYKHEASKTEAEE